MDSYESFCNERIPMEEIEAATNNFADGNIIARGSYATIYKGQFLRSGESINIVIRKRDKLIDTMAYNEMKLYSVLNHTNIKSPLCMCLNYNKQVWAIHKHETNESLDKHLGGSTLTWMQRLHICVGVAHGLHYLHFGLSDDYSVIHGNIKSSKILLDHNWEPKLHDFRCAATVKRHHLYLTSNYDRTLQYMDPALEISGGLTHKSDVFSFGVVLFEVLFGMKASIQEDDVWQFAKMARLHYVEKRLDDMIDRDLQKQMDAKSLELFAETAYYCLKEQRAERPDTEQIVKRLESALELHQSFVHPAATIEGASSDCLKGGHVDHLRVPLSKIKLATDNFLERHCIGSGAFGQVYKAELSCFDGTRTVAIKRIFKRGDGQAEQGFTAEIEMLSKCKHTNIVSLLGFCDEDDEMILIYEYASNGTLEGYLGNVDNMTNFTWAQRIKVCLDIAHGLQYLHTGIHGEYTIIHRDIKSENILLDDKWVAKIADFGLSKLHQGDQNFSTLATMRIAGTPYYIDPVYRNEVKLKKKSDIYSFGVVLFEIMCGRLAYDGAFGEEGLAVKARQCYENRTLMQLVDPKIKEADENISILNGGVNQTSLDKFSEISYKCVAENQNDRPTIEDVIKELEEALSYQENNKDRLHISLGYIKSATENFSEHKCIGEGRYWKQYEAKITHVSGSTMDAVKRWDSSSPQARHQFFTELQILNEYKHENIISLVGYCTDMDEKIIVYGIVSNGSLDKHLKFDGLPWMRRLKISIDVAKGLEFLLTSASMIHRDIKSASILLDGDWKAKISNLELSTQLLELKPIEHVTDDNAYGSLSYISREDKEWGYLTAESDIYSLGVVLREMLLGRLVNPGEHYGPSNGLQIFLLGEHQWLNTFVLIAGLCLASKKYRPSLREVITELEKALELRVDYEIWEPKLPPDYKEIIKMSKPPRKSYFTSMKKDLYDMFTKGILLQDGKVLFSLGTNGERNEMISARKFSYKNRGSHKWRSLQESRFEKVAKVFFVSNLNIKINIRTQLLSLGINYGVHLVFKFCGAKKSSTKPMFVNLTYKMGNEIFHAYFATWRDDDWMMVKLHHFLKIKDDNEFEFVLESFSQCYFGKRVVYIEGVEFRAIDKVKDKEIEKIKEAQVLKSDLNTDQVQPMPTWISRQVIEFKRIQVISMKDKISGQMLSPDTEYTCYLVFKLSEQCRGLHCPIRVRDVLHWKKKAEQNHLF